VTKTNVQNANGKLSNEYDMHFYLL